MSDIAIRVEGLSKQYRIGKRERYKTLRDTLTDAVTAPVRRLRSALSGPHGDPEENPGDLIWALKDVSFEVPHGAVVGVIGRNGAGKSTLLKILSRITEPTEGYAEVRGRVGSLLEVGTGFHPELTGRENIYLNGAILGMKRAEIERKFEKIVAFAEVEKFIDTPVKHFSSGMYTRLAFAVAAHMETEILIIDEVLAVGDGQFQKKCLGKMGEVAKEGRTVVFVSHQMNQIRRLCDSSIWMNNGHVERIGPAAEVISLYEESFRPDFNAHNIGRDIAQSHFVSWIGEQGGREETTLTDDVSVTFRFRVRMARRITNGHHGVALFNSDNVLIWAYASNGIDLSVGMHELCYSFPVLPIKPGLYRWQLSLFDEAGLIDLWEALPPLRIHTPLRTHHSDQWQGVLNLRFSMAVQHVERGISEAAVISAKQ